MKTRQDRTHGPEGDAPLPKLREEAEARLAAAPAPAAQPRSAVELLHELQVHQLELEMQNEALRQSQVALEQSRDRYVDLYEFAPVGYLTLGDKGLIAAANLTATTLLGRERKKLLQRRFDSLVDDHDRERWQRLFIALLRSQETADIELALTRGDGSPFHARLDCRRVATHGGPGALRITLADVSERKHAELRAAQLLQRIEALMRHAHDCIMVLDASTRIVAVSDSCLVSYGYRREEMLAMGADDLRVPEAGAAVPDLLQRLGETGSLLYRTWHCRRDGNRFPVEVGATLIEIDGQRHFQAIVRDISAAVAERETLERALADASQRTKELSRNVIEVQEGERRRLSGELHDRTSPNLAAIKINLKLLAALSADKATERAERLEDTFGLVADTDASIRAISSELRPPLLDYAGLGKAVEGYARQFAKRTGIAVSVDCRHAAARLAPAVESLLFRIFQEALTNCARHAQARAIAVSLNSVDSPAAMVIEDDGCGFDTRLVGTTGPTSGLGLLNMADMAEFAGGHCVVASHPGKGTRVEVTI